MLQEKLIQAIKKIKHEVDECHEAEKDTFADAVDVEVKTGNSRHDLFWKQQN